MIVTLMTAGLCGLLYLWLSIRVVQVRQSAKVLLGDGGDELLLSRIRAHANFAEYVPICLILIGVIELTDDVSPGGFMPPASALSWYGWPMPSGWPGAAPIVGGKSVPAAPGSSCSDSASGRSSRPLLTDRRARHPRHRRCCVARRQRSTSGHGRERTPSGHPTAIADW